MSIGKRLDEKAKFDFKINGFIIWETNRNNTHYPRPQEVKTSRQCDKSYTSYGEETSRIPFSEKSKLGMSLDQLPEILHRFFYFMAKSRTIKIY